MSSKKTRHRAGAAAAETAAPAVAAAPQATSRNYGIDLLRLVAMFYIVIQHIFLQGGAMYTTTADSTQYHISHFLEVFTYCGANIFALISGYVCVTEKEKPVKFASYLNLWLEILFYGLAALVFYCCMGHAGDLTRMDFYGIFLPVISSSYWYFSAYTGLFVLMPILNAGIRNSSKETLRYVFIAMILTFATISMMLKYVGVGSGYTTFWLVLLYIFGAIIKKCEIGKRIPSIVSIILILLLTYVSNKWKMKATEHTVGPLTVDKALLSKYTSITIVVIAMLHVIMFAKMRMPGWLIKFVKFAGPCSFAIYVINCQSLIWDHYFKNGFRSFGQKDTLPLLLSVFGSALLFVAGAIIVDRIRIALFKAMHVSQFTAWVEKKFRAFFGKICEII